MLMSLNFGPIWSNKRPPKLDILGGRLREVQNVLFFPAEAEYFYFPANLRLKICFLIFLDYSV